MTSVHAYTQSQSNTNNTSLDQTIQSPNNFNKSERVHRRMDELRKHHNESEEIYNRTQPIINEQIHVETMKYLKTDQVNEATKPKSQKPRAQRKSKNSSSNVNISGVNDSNATNLAQSINTTNSNIVTNGFSSHQSQVQPIPSQSQPNHIQQSTIYTPHVPQQSVSIQPKQTQPIRNQQQQQQHIKYQPTTNVYQQLPQQHQPTIQVQKQYQNPQQPMYSQQQQSQHMHLQTQTLHNHTNQPSEQNKYVAQQPIQNHLHLNGTHLVSNNHGTHQQNYGYATSYAPVTPSQNDLDLTLQAGLECDVDSLIRHEMSVEGRLEFNHDLLLKLDNHYHPYQH